MVQASRAALARWEDLRHELGANPDRGPLLRFFCAAAGYDPYPGQVTDHLASSRSAFEGDGQNKLQLGGYGAGKTMWEIAESLLGIVANPGGDHLITSASHKQARGVLLPRYRAFVETMARNGYPLERRWKEAVGESLLHCGGVVRFGTYSKLDTHMGFEYTTILADEIELMLRAAKIFGALKSRLRQTVGPSGPIHWRQIHAGSTPDGVDGKAVGLFMANRALADGMEGEERREQLLKWYWSRRTGYDNPYLPRGYMEGQKASLSKRRWEQEGLGKILRPASAVFPEFDHDRHLVSVGYDPQLPWDITYDAGDTWPHVLWISRRPADQDVVFDELCPDGWPIDKLHREIVSRCKRLHGNPGLVVCDRAVKRERRWLQDTFPASNVRWMRSREEQNVLAGLEVVRARLDPVEGVPRLFFSESLRRTEGRRGILKCLRNLRRKRLADGTVSRAVYKDNVHDHGVDCLRMHQRAAHASDTRVSTMYRRYS